MILEKKYQELENNFIKCSELKKINTIEGGEPFVYISKNRNLGEKYFKSDMLKYFNGNIIVRKSILEKLILISNFLKNNHKDLKLVVVYGYRSLSIQKEYFDNYFNIVKKRYSNISDMDKIREITHRGAACPEVAGHPTGGAVDVTLYNLKNNCFLDMGTDPGDYSTKKCYQLSPEVNEYQKKNRVFLSNLMKKWGFAPYLGEWWHFSYGDKEWACFYNKKESFYDVVDIENIRLT